MKILGPIFDLKNCMTDLRFRCNIERVMIRVKRELWIGFDMMNRYTGRLGSVQFYMHFSCMLRPFLFFQVYISGHFLSIAKAYSLTQFTN